MDLILFIVGFAAGLFLWASILGVLFVMLPMVVKLKRSGIIDNIHKTQIILPITVAVILLAIGYLLSPPIGWGATFGGVSMLFNLTKMRSETVENVAREYRLNAELIEVLISL